MLTIPSKPAAVGSVRPVAAMLVDGPAVLAWDVRHEDMEAYGLRLVRDALAAVGARPVEPLAHILLAALHEAARYLARADDTVTARREVGAVVDRLLSAL